MSDFPVVNLSPQQYALDYDSYDKAVARLCNSLKLVDQNGIPTTRPIPLIFSTPERAWALMRKKFAKDISSNRDFRIPLPFLSVQQIGDTVFDPHRYLYKAILYRRVAIDTSDYKTALAHPHPLPFTFQYSIELWTKTRYEARVAVAQFASLWDEGGMLYRLVDHGTPLGVKYIPMFLTGITDNTNLETADRERSLRWTFTLRVEGWLPPATIEQKLVHTLDVTVETPADLCFPDDPYTDTELEGYRPLLSGNPATGEVVEDTLDFDPGYTGTDYRLSRFSESNPCVSG